VVIASGLGAGIGAVEVAKKAVISNKYEPIPISLFLMVLN